MFQSLRLGRIFGIVVEIHPTFWLLPLLIILTGFGRASGIDIGWELILTFAVFGCVALHELGHALAASWYGIRTRSITMYPIGGVARLENVPERALPEIVIALAGPMVNVLIALAIAAMMLLDRTLPTDLIAHPGDRIEAFWARLLIANISLVLFNLIPAFPMDGGRVFRAVLSLVMNRVRATEIAVYVGGVLAAIIGIGGLFWANSIMLPVLAVMVYLMGRAELEQVRMMEEYRRSGERFSDRTRVRYDRGLEGRADGFEYDPQQRMWTEFRDGLAIRRFRAE